MNSSSHIVNVDRYGMTANGDDTNLFAGEEPVHLGYMVNVPILAKYPDGTLRSGNLVKVTPAGMDFFRLTMPLDIRRPEGRA